MLFAMPAGVRSMAWLKLGIIKAKRTIPTIIADFLENIFGFLFINKLKHSYLWL
jgi:hypothetical protein